MDNVDLAQINPQNTKNLSSSKKNKSSANSFKKLYQTMMDNTARRAKEAESRKKRRLASIIQKLLAGIPLTSDEMQFLKANAPVYYNQAMRQQRSHMTKNAYQHKISEIDKIEPIDTI